LKVVCDVEADGLTDVTKLWVVVCKEVDTGVQHVFRNVHDDPGPFRSFARKVSLWIGHNFIGFDAAVLNKLVGPGTVDYLLILDTLVLSKLFNFRIEGGHSLGAWGSRFGVPKSEYEDWTQWSQELEDRCIVDTDITLKLYQLLLPYISKPEWKRSIEIEHASAIICQDMHENGFQFNLKKAKEIHERLVELRDNLDQELRDAFPPRSVPIRTITPKLTKHGTLHRGDFRFLGDNDLSNFSVGASFSTFRWVAFNPGSVVQINQRLEGLWDPVEKTKSGNLWKVNEANLETVQEDAPDAVKTLVKRFMVQKRISTLEEWFGAVRPSVGSTHRIHGNVNHIGTWTHRCSHDNPNMGNVPSIASKYGSKELKDLAYEFGVILRSLWEADTGLSLVGCDADGIQLRIFAHYINDPEFTRSLVDGRKEDGTDCHSLNAQKLGDGVSRDQAKTFIYSFLLGSGVGKTAHILNCAMGEAKERRNRFVDSYPGLVYVREELIPRDIARGYFEGIDGRKVIIPPNVLARGNVAGAVLGGYLQNGETCVMKHANLRWRKALRDAGIPFKQVNFIHDEWQTVTEGNIERDCTWNASAKRWIANSGTILKAVGDCQADSIREIGVELGLNCPMAGNYVVGHNWFETH